MNDRNILKSCLMLVFVLRLICKIVFFVFPKFYYDNHCLWYFCFRIIWRLATCCWLNIRSKNTCFMQLVVLLSVFLRLTFRNSIDLLNCFWQKSILAIFFSDRLASNHWLLARGNSEVNKSLVNASCWISRLSFWDWVFRISKNLLTLSWQRSIGV